LGNFSAGFRLQIKHVWQKLPLMPAGTLSESYNIWVRIVHYQSVRAHEQSMAQNLLITFSESGAETPFYSFSTKETKLMKKALLIIVAAASIVLVSSQAWACYWDGYWGGPMGGYYGGAQMGGYYGGASQGFLNDTAQLRQDLAAKQGEYAALMAQSKPDPKKAADLSRQIATFHDQLRSKAQTYSLPAPVSGYGFMGSYGYGCW
jgi:zinc resistance-associated protein